MEEHEPAKKEAALASRVAKRPRLSYCSIITEEAPAGYGDLTYLLAEKDPISEGSPEQSGSGPAGARRGKRSR